MQGVGDLSDEVASVGQGKYFVSMIMRFYEPLAAMLQKLLGLGQSPKASTILRNHKMEITINESK